MRILLVVALGALLSGCAYGGTDHYAGPGSSQDFANARYQCYASLRGISGVANAQIARLKAPVSCGELDVCMASRGYVRNKNGRHDSSSISVNCH